MARVMLRRLTTAAAILTGLITIGAAGIWLEVRSLGAPPLDRVAEVSTVVLDRNDRLLRAFTTTDQRWRLPLAKDEVDPRYLAMLFAFEDKRFHEHGGIDILAAARAAYQFVTNRRIVSGASTLTMQVARLIDGGTERTASGKFRQAARAVQLERTLSKSEIIELYLKLAPMGGNIEGVRAASLAYFGKEPRRLSVGEAALLVALPQSPEWRRPDRAPEAARRARDRVLDRVAAAGVLSAADAERAKGETVPVSRRDFQKLAPHLSEAEYAAAPQKREHRLTLDRSVQSALEDLAQEQAHAMGDKVSAAILAVDHTSGDVIAHVGSAGYLDHARLGQIDMVRAVRSPGSTLKPIIYGLAFEAGLAHPETLIEDRPARFGAYRPQNFDEGFRGTVTIREALSHSLNIPAVKALDAVGPARLMHRLRRAGIAAELPDNMPPSLGMALGGVGLRMQDLTALYAGLARGGGPVTLRWRRGDPPAQPSQQKLLGPVAAWYVTDILKDAPPPPAAVGGRIAYKTGTSYGYRDAWAIGYDGRHTIAVWVGRADGAPTTELMGRTAAAPILFDAFARIGGQRAALPSAPSGALRMVGASLPPPLKRFRERDAEPRTGPFAVARLLISFPPDRAEVELDGAEAALQLMAEGGALPLTWLVDGAPVPSDPHRRELAWQPNGRGFVKLSVIDAMGRVDRAMVRLK